VIGTLEQLQNLMSTLVQQCKLDHLQLLPALGQMLVVKFDGQFYRARVLDFVEDEEPVKILVGVELDLLNYETHKCLFRFSVLTLVLK